MTGWAWVSVVVIAACVGSVVALLTDWLRSESRRLTDDLARIGARLDADRNRPYDQDRDAS